MISSNVIYANKLNYSALKREHIAHFDTPHQATSQRQPFSQDVHHEYSSKREQALPPHKLSEAKEVMTTSHSNQEKQSSQSLCVEQVQVSVPIKLNLTLTVQMDTNQQLHSPFCSDEQIAKWSE